MMRWVPCLVSMLLLVACGKHKHDTSPSTFHLNGMVLNQDQEPVAGATVAIVGTGLTATTDASGTFEIAQSSPADTNVVVAVQSTGYVKQTMRTQLKSDASVATNILLQKVGLSMPVTLPAQGDPAVIVAADGNDGGATLTIGYGALAKADGTQATGDAVVNLTYYHPRQLQSSMPIPLLTVGPDGTTLAPLTTFGMADITIMQGDEELQVMAGATLGLTFKAMTAQQDFVTENARDQDALPRLYSANKELGLWIEEATLGTDNLMWDANTTSFVAKLPHLSSWNIDNLDRGAGGCMQGTVYTSDKSGKQVPAGGTPIRVWFAGRDEVGFFDVTTNGAGQYCIEPGIAHGAPSNTVRYFVSAQNNPGASSMCNPLPSYCSSCVDTTIANDCQNCGLRDDVICNDTATFGNYDLAFNVTGYAGCNPRVPCTTSSSRDDLLGRCKVKSGGATVPAYQETCPSNQRFYATLKAGAHCGGACFVAEPVSIKGEPPGQTTTTTPPAPKPVEPKPCDPASKNTRYAGQSCIPSVDTCCPNNGSLVCEDYVCLPPLKN